MKGNAGTKHSFRKGKPLCRDIVTLDQQPCCNKGHVGIIFLL